MSLSTIFFSTIAQQSCLQSEVVHLRSARHFFFFHRMILIMLFISSAITSAIVIVIDMCISSRDRITNNEPKRHLNNRASTTSMRLENTRQCLLNECSVTSAKRIICCKQTQSSDCYEIHVEFDTHAMTNHH